MESKVIFGLIILSLMIIIRIFSSIKYMMMQKKKNKHYKDIFNQLNNMNI